jgi:hypothetical protein
MMSVSRVHISLSTTLATACYPTILRAVRHRRARGRSTYRQESAPMGAKTQHTLKGFVPSLPAACRAILQ